MQSFVQKEFCERRIPHFFIACSYSKVGQWGPSQWGAAARWMESSHFGKACLFFFFFFWQSGALSEVSVLTLQTQPQEVRTAVGVSRLKEVWEVSP